MTADEQKQWLADFQQWVGVSLPAMEVEWASGSPELMKKGLELVSAFPYGDAFATPIIRTHNYHSKYLKVLRLLCERIIKELSQRGMVSNGTSRAGVSGASDLVLNENGEVNPSLLTKHIGRPTKREQQARAIHEERIRKAENLRQPSMFPESDIQASPAAPNTLSGTVMGGQMLHLDQLKCFMSPELSADVEKIRGLRAACASASERAKALADEQSSSNPDSKLQQKIAEAAQDARRYADAFTDIYARVDEEMASCYVRLKEDSTYMEAMQTKGYNLSELRTMLRPYFDKKGDDKEAFKQQVIEQINANDPKQAAERQAAAERKQHITMLIKYITRTDKPNSATRLATMAKRVEELAQYLPENEMQKYRDILADAQAHPAIKKSKK